LYSSARSEQRCRCGAKIFLWSNRDVRESGGGGGGGGGGLNAYVSLLLIMRPLRSLYREAAGAKQLLSLHTSPLSLNALLIPGAYAPFIWKIHFKIEKITCIFPHSTYSPPSSIFDGSVAAYTIFCPATPTIRHH
jgi:hypothetical protein